MMLGTDALTLVKDVKKFEAQRAQLAKAEKGAKSAITSANKKADQIIADAQAVENKSKQLLADAKARIKVAESVERENEATVLAAQEETQKANAHEGRLQKAKQKLAEERAAFDIKKGEFADGGLVSGKSDYLMATTSSTSRAAKDGHHRPVCG